MPRIPRTRCTQTHHEAYRWANRSTTIELGRKQISVNNQLFLCTVCTICASVFRLSVYGIFCICLLLCASLYLNSQTHLTSSFGLCRKLSGKCCSGYEWMMVSLEVRPDFVIPNACDFQIAKTNGRQRVWQREWHTHTHIHIHRNNPQTEIAEIRWDTEHSLHIYQIWYRFVL